MAHEEHAPDELADVPPRAHRRRDWLARAQVVLPLLAVLGIAVFWGVDYARQEKARYNPGPLAVVHATWDQNCTACHVDAQPLGGNNWLASLSHATHGADAQCQHCHAAPPHHSKERAADVPGCTGCHREHQGRQADLLRVASAHCTRCHQDLPAHLSPGATAAFQNVTRFDGEAAHHPEFRVLREKDPGHVEFNHRLHMMPGLRAQAGSSVPFTLQDIPAPLRERYRLPGQGDDAAPVRLECASCHRSTGAYMTPVTYENHCQACHPLDVPSKLDKGSSLTLRHRLQPAEVHAFLEGYFAEQFLKGDLALLDRPLRPLPGKLPFSAVEKQTARTLIEKNVAQAEKIAFGPNTCQKCHRALDPDLGAAQRIEPADIPRIWYKNARFDHTPHRAVSCRECHSRAYASSENGEPNPRASHDKDDVLLPGIATCQKCHAPAHGTDSTRVGGARFDCVECHRYHGGDRPLHGPGGVVRALAPARRMSIEDFLEGRLHP
jgi:predicted CXXCH cytochrome family protein